MQKIEWSEIQNDIHKLCTKIIDTSNCLTDNIIAVGRGGLIVATLIAYRLNIPKIHNYGLSSYTYNNQPGNITEYQLPNFLHLENKKVLLIDDLSDKGNTLRHVTNNLNEQCIDHSTCTLYIKNGTSFMPDFYSRVFPDDVWISFPWDL